MAYNAYITEIKDVEKHSNADRLQVGKCFGNQVIVGLDVNEGDIGVYFPSDGQLGVEYCDENNLIRKKDQDGNNIGGYLDPDKRNIRALKLRGEISDGLFMPLESLNSFTNISKLKVGELISVLGGVEICKKYIPRSNQHKSTNSNSSKKKAKVINYPYFNEHKDTKQLAYCMANFSEGDICYITLKMHGTSGRTSYTKRIEPKFKNSLLKKMFHDPKRESWSLMTGTRRVVLENYDGGFYGSNSFRQKYHDMFEGKLRKGETVYYEIVGYMDSDRPIMGRVSNKKTNDKEFIKQYGETTIYSYGCEPGENDIFIYRMSTLDAGGNEIDYPWDYVKTRAEQMGLKVVHEFNRFIYTTEEDLMQRIRNYVDGVDPIGLTHIREGVVVRIEGKEQFKAYKHKNFTFKLLEGIIKDSGEVDIEEEQEL